MMLTSSTLHMAALLSISSSVSLEESFLSSYLLFLLLLRLAPSSTGESG
jgi:hypothetical protein